MRAHRQPPKAVGIGLVLVWAHSKICVLNVRFHFPIEKVSLHSGLPRLGGG